MESPERAFLDSLHLYCEHVVGSKSQSGRPGRDEAAAASSAFRALGLHSFQSGNMEMARRYWEESLLVSESKSRTDEGSANANASWDQDVFALIGEDDVSKHPAFALSETAGISLDGLGKSLRYHKAISPSIFDKKQPTQTLSTFGPGSVSKSVTATTTGSAGLGFDALRDSRDSQFSRIPPSARARQQESKRKFSYGEEETHRIPEQPQPYGARPPQNQSSGSAFHSARQEMSAQNLQRFGGRGRGDMAAQDRRRSRGRGRYIAGDGNPNHAGAPPGLLAAVPSIDSRPGAGHARPRFVSPLLNINNNRQEEEEDDTEEGSYAGYSLGPPRKRLGRGRGRQGRGGSSNTNTNMNSNVNANMNTSSGSRNKSSGSKDKDAPLSEHDEKLAALLEDERLRGIDPKLVETVLNEVITTDPSVTWDDIAGLEFAKKCVMEIVVWPMIRPDLFTGLRGPPKGLLLFGPPGTGKCLAPDTPILMYDGRVKMVQDVEVGDKLMGDDSTARRVFSTTSGTDMMYRVKQRRAMDYVGNGAHILVLRRIFRPVVVTRRKRDRDSHHVIVKWMFNNELRRRCFSFTEDTYTSVVDTAEKYCNLLIEGIDYTSDNILEVSIEDYLKMPKASRVKYRGFLAKSKGEEKVCDSPLQIERVGYGSYHGFQIDGNGRFLLSDYTVTHNTMIGKAIASQSGATFFSISASSLMSKWVGEGEKMVRALFAVARCNQPAVIFVDEIDSLLSQRSEGDFEASRRVKTEFLVQLDGAATSSEDRILFIGATNRPQELDEAARRRLVKRLYIPLPDSFARASLIRHLTRDQPHAMSEEDIEWIVDATEGYSGADVRHLCSEAALGPIRDLSIGGVRDITTVEVDSVRLIMKRDFQAALQQARASVSGSELSGYLEWNKLFGSFPAEEISLTTAAKAEGDEDLEIS